MIDYSTVTEKVKELAISVGQFIKEESKTFDLEKVEFKEFNNLVSYVDKEAEKKLVEGLKIILPDAGFITEEGTDSTQGEEYNWVIDPLDGTTNFTHGLPIYSVSIGLATEDDILIGVVYEVNRDECFHAWKDGGAYLNGKRIHVSKAEKLEQSLIATGFPYYMFDKVDTYFSIMKEMMMATQGLRRLGSAAVDLCYVACGRYEGYFEFNLNSYDVMGGAIIVKEAGGVVTDFTGGKRFMNGEEIIAAGAVHAPMLEIVEKYWKG